MALFFALGGSAIAARHYLLTSTSQIKPSVLRQLHGRSGPPGPHGEAGGAGPRGSQGLQGPIGPQGPASSSKLSALTPVFGPKNPVTAFTGGELGAGESVATCPAGMRVVSGGITFVFVVPASEFSRASENRSSWIVGVRNASEFEGGEIEAIAYCAGAGQAVTARAAPSAARAQAIRESRRRLASLPRRTRARKAPAR